MNRTGGSTVSGSRSASLRSVDSFLEAKLHRPSAHEDSVDRGRLCDRLEHAVACPLVLVAAPAGFGKTTLIAQWLVTRRLPRATAWVSLDAGDNDPVRPVPADEGLANPATCVVASDIICMSETVVPESSATM